MIMAYALSRAGAAITYVTNRSPIFQGDFEILHKTSPIDIIIDENYTAPDGISPDWVIVIPTGSFDDRFYSAALRKAEQWRARVALLSFETPNWYNELSPYPRSPLPTEAWRQVVARGGLVVTIAREGVGPAREFYGASRDGADLYFGHWHPAINDPVASLVQPEPLAEKRVLAFVRTEDPHKGAADLLRLPSDIFNGMILSLIFGRGVDEAYVAALRRHFAAASDFSIELHSRIQDSEKFRLLAGARMLLFPSYFEGYGYPPVEAAWMGVPTVAYDLPVLRETVGDAALYAPRGDSVAFAEAVRTTLKGRGTSEEIKSQLRVQVDCGAAGAKLLRLLSTAAHTVAPIAPTRPVLCLPKRKDSPLQASSQPMLSSILANYGGPIQLFDLTATMKGRDVRITGSVRGAYRSYRLRFEMEGVVLPEVCLPDSTSPSTFSCEGSIERWPHGHQAICTVWRVAADGSETFQSMIEVKADLATLLDRQLWTGSGHRVPVQRADEVLILADGFESFRDPNAAMVLSEMTETLRQGGYPTRLLIPAHSANGSPPIHSEFLPLADVVENIPSDELLPRAERALSEGGAVIAAAGVDLTGLSQTAAAVASAGTMSSDISILLPEPTDQPVLRIISLPNPILARRSMLARRRDVALVVLGKAHNAEVPAYVAEAIQRLKASGDWRLQVLYPRPSNAEAAELWFADPQFGGRVVDDAELAAMCFSVGTIIGLDLRQSPVDIAVETLLAHYGTPVTLLPAEGVKGTELAGILGYAVKSKMRGDLEPDGIAAAISRLFPAKAAKSATDVRMTPLIEVSPKALPRLGMGEALNFQAPGTQHETALSAGWAHVGQDGALLGAGCGVVGFECADDVFGQVANLEILIDYRQITEAPTRIAIIINGHEVRDIALKPTGVQRISVPFSPASTRGERVQYLGFARVSAAAASAGRSVGAGAGNGELAVRSPIDEATAPPVEIKLVALSLMPSSPTKFDWSAFSPDVTSPVVVREVDQLPVGLLSEKSTNKSEESWFRLGRGWSSPEPEGVWSDGPGATIEFPPIEHDAPVLLSISCGAFPADVSGLQRVAVSSGLTSLGTAVVSSTDPNSQIRLVLSPSIREQGIDYLMLQFPDALSPAELGMSADPRLLGVRLRRINVGYAATDPVSTCELQGGTVGMLALPGIVRVVGSGAVESGMGFRVRGESFIANPQPLGATGWEVWLVVTPRAGKQPVVIDIVVPESESHLTDQIAPRIERLESWALPGEVPARSKFEVVFSRDVRPNDDRISFAASTVLPGSTSSGLFRKILPAPSKSPQIGTGWSAPAEGFIWSTKRFVSLQLGDDVGLKPGLLRIKAGWFLSKGHRLQRAGLYAAGFRFATLFARDADTSGWTIPVPGNGIFAGPLTIDLPDAISPRAVDKTDDDRPLGLRLVQASIEPLPKGRKITQTLPSGWSFTAVSVARGLIVTISGDGKPPLGCAVNDPSMLMHPVRTGADTWSTTHFVPDRAARSSECRLLVCHAGTIDWPDPSSVEENALFYVDPRSFW